MVTKLIPKKFSPQGLCRGHCIPEGLARGSHAKSIDAWKLEKHRIQHVSREQNRLHRVLGKIAVGHYNRGT